MWYGVRVYHPYVVSQESMTSSPGRAFQVGALERAFGQFHIGSGQLDSYYQFPVDTDLVAIEHTPCVAALGYPIFLPTTKIYQSYHIIRAKVTEKLG